MLYRCHMCPYSRKNSGSGNRLHIDSMQHVITYLGVLSTWNTVKIPGSIQGDILLSATYCQNQNLNYRPVPEVSEGKWWNPLWFESRSRDVKHHLQIISTCNWGHMPFHQDLGSEKHENTSHGNYPSFRISFEIELKFCHVKVEFPKVCGWGFQYAKVQATNILPNNHHNHRMHVIWGIQLGISQLHLGRARARPGKSSGWKMILSFWDGLLLGAILVSEGIALNQIGKSR